MFQLTARQTGQTGCYLEETLYVVIETFNFTSAFITLHSSQLTASTYYIVDLETTAAKNQDSKQV